MTIFLSNLIGSPAVYGVLGVSDFVGTKRANMHTQTRATRFVCGGRVSSWLKLQHAKQLKTFGRTPMAHEKVYRFPLQDLRGGETHRIKFPPTVHVAEGSISDCLF